MSHNSSVTRSGDLDSLPFWISDHLGQGSSFMTNEINQSPASPMEGSPSLETNLLVPIHPSMEKKTNIMTLEELDALREAYSFPSRVRVRLPEEGETITSARPGEVAFYEVAFPVGLRFPIRPTIRLILQFYNICPAQLVPNAWRSIIYSMAIWQARNKNTLLGGYPSNVKGWKSKFFFILGDEWELPEGSPREGAPRVPRTWGVLDKHCNNTPRLYGDEPKVFEEIFKSVEAGRFTVPVLLESKSFRRVFVSLGSMASGTAGESRLSGEAPSSSGDVAMSKRINFKKLGEKLEKSKNRSSSGIPAPVKGVVIDEKRAGESLTSSASKKGKVDDGSKGKGVDREPKGKKKATSSTNAPTTPATASSRPGEGTSATIGAALGPTASILGSPFVVEKLLQGVIPPSDKEKALVLSSSLAVRSREAGEQASLQEGRATSLETKVARLQKLSADLEQQLAEARVREQQANDELAKTKSDRDSLVDKVERSGVLVVELREALSKAKESSIEEFKSSSEFVVAIEDSASKYFGEGFDFCKVQLRRHHPDLAIDLEGTMVDQDLLAEQDEAAEEKEKEKVGERTRGIKKIPPLFN
ncbi:hypothetical protein Acr_00g0055020 [Actinidia rufa]|uniref:Uncharacterized protein n=1 Tax=Actinidia rufa TaxID=165716 RepID=A0A7J0DNB2_9ERIC|nr:hypothetical protein Acr_00g0055020 [Actinidia rufa]